MGSRRQAMQQLAAALLVVHALPAQATPESLRDAMRTFTGSTVPREGLVTLDIAPLVENGNAVPVTVSVDSTGLGRVQRIALFTERNPLPEMASFELGARIGRPQVATRMRLATSQHIIALALFADGSCWIKRVEVVVTLAACIEG